MAATSIAGQRDEFRLVSDILASITASSVGRAGVSPARADLGSARVLDCGGGTGRMAVPLAQLGAEVTVVDISADALATLARRAADAGVRDRVHPVQGDIETLGDAVGASRFELVLLHGVLGAVEPQAALAGAHGALAPGGLASILIANPAAAVIVKVLAGELDAALRDLRALREGAVDGSRDSGRHSARSGASGPAGVGGAQLDAGGVVALCRSVGLLVEQIGGVGVFAELIPSASSDTVGGRSLAELSAELESASSDLSPFREIAARLHVLARRPAAD